ncbi:cellulose biosynthesis protein BcsG [Castellaniella sp.]|uniref:cellulose biosynthesis protein BcsG n=1 Tax=Castellaniella sp. TaxID=1955812 RepID=UPI003C7177FF
MTTEMPNGSPSLLWKGLGLWNLYFIAKLLMYWFGVIQFDVYLNLLFAAALLFPLRNVWLSRLRQLLAVPAGIALLYHDTWYPPFSRLLAQRHDLLGFSPAYLLELMSRFINWDLIGAGFIFLVAYLFAAQWLRMTTFTVLALVSVSLSSVAGINMGSWVTPGAGVSKVLSHSVAQTEAAPTLQPGGGPAAQSASGVSGQQAKPTQEQLNQALTSFYTSEATRVVEFPASMPTEQPFDVLVLSICSLSWADLQASGLDNHPLLQGMDVIFDQFNAATSYSGPAVLRLMRASCGQVSHQALYQPAEDRCFLFDNLEKLGFKTETALNHNGQFQGFLDEITASGRFPKPYIPEALDARLRAFDGSPIWGDLDTLTHWWQQRTSSGDSRVALLYNSITLHDGNREATAAGGSQAAPYGDRLRRLFDNLSAFFAELQRSGRKVLVVLVPEHGAALQGDRMQIPGMREIPSPSITRVPVALKLIGAKAPHGQPVKVEKPSSFLALSELMSELVSIDAFEQPALDWTRLVATLPETNPVSENDGTVLMEWQQNPYVRMGQGSWIPYPK